MNNKHPQDSVTPFHSQAEIKAQAAAWLVQMDQGRLSEQAAEELKAWARRSDFHQAYLAKLARNWDAMGELEELAVLFPLPEKEYDQRIAADGRPAAKPFWHWTGWGLGLPAGLAATVLLGLLVIWPAAMPEQQRFVTGVGEQARHTLADGTVITLNTQSVVKVDYRGEHRKITLTRGEANFDVAKDPNRPFVVYAGEGLVWAVGTAFNVYLNRGGVDVMVSEGRVKVFTDVIPEQAMPALRVDLSAEASVANRLSVNQSAQPATEMLVAAGEALQYRQHIEQLAELEPDTLKQKLAWQQGSLVFKGETLEQALTEISRYTEQALVIVDPSIKNTRIGGHFKTDNIDALLLSLSESFGIRIERVSANRIHLSAQPATQPSAQPSTQL